MNDLLSLVGHSIVYQGVRAFMADIPSGQKFWAIVLFGCVLVVSRSWRRRAARAAVRL